jgi:23S rRNA pseudouridine1911/1915/1917 synthase
MVVHPGAGVHGGTLVNALLGYSEETFRPMGEEGRPGIVHRLDKETSGVLVVAKSRKILEKLSRSFANREVDKFYIALVRGHLRMMRGTLETFIGRSKTNRQKMKVYEEDDGVGKEAVTHYKVMAQNNGVSLLKIKIDTGRTHQIRVHMSEMGFPVIGDKVYGAKRLEEKDSPDRHLLHAWRIRIPHPESGKQMTFTAPMPEQFISIAEGFGIEVNG